MSTYFEPAKEVAAGDILWYQFDISNPEIVAGCGGYEILPVMVLAVKEKYIEVCLPLLGASCFPAIKDKLLIKRIR